MKKNIWDIIFWIGMIILIGYIILKLLGIINTPDWWVNLLPLISLAFIIGAFYQKVMTSMDILNNRISYLKNHMDNMNERLLKIEHKTWK